MPVEMERGPVSASGCKERGAESSDRRQPARQPYCAARWRIYLPSKALLHCAPVVCLRFLGDQLHARLRMSGYGRAAVLLMRGGKGPLATATADLPSQGLTTPASRLICRFFRQSLVTMLTLWFQLARSRRSFRDDLHPLIPTKIFMPCS